MGSCVHLEKGFVHSSKVRIGDIMDDGRRIVEILGSNGGKHGRYKIQVRFDDSSIEIYSP